MVFLKLSRENIRTYAQFVHNLLVTCEISIYCVCFTNNYVEN